MSGSTATAVPKRKLFNKAIFFSKKEKIYYLA